MKHLKLTIGLAFLLLNVMVYGGGIVTNTNQSAAWVRMFARDASTDLDAVYYNPAGLTALGKGFYFSLNNQFIFSKRYVKNNYPYLNNHEYIGDIVAPVFPGIYGAYSTGKFVFSFGFNVVGGGGSVVYNKGLPSFEIGVSDLIPSLSAAPNNVSAYSSDVYFKGTSIFLGYQAGVSYKVNDMVSVFAGLRYVTAKNTYSGYLRNVNVNSNGTWLPASALLGGIANQMQSMIGIPTSLQPLVTGGGGSLTLAQAQGAGYLPAAQAAAIEQGLAYIGVSSAAISAMTITQVQGAFTAATPTLQASYYSASIKSKLLRNQQADVEQTGHGICPIIGADLKINEKLNIGLKYEFATKMNVTNKTSADFVVDSLPGQPATTMFPNGEKTPSDMPALLTMGASYKLFDKLKVSGGFHYYFDKSVNYGHTLNGDIVDNKQLINKNNYELALGFEYNLNEKLLLSTGYLYTNTGIKDEFNTDINYCLSSHSFGFGGKWAVSSKVDFDLGVSYTEYIPSSKIYTHTIETTPAQNVTVKEKYYKNVLIFAIGFNVKLSKSE
jgi:long-subunit fatty acid transport protein